ncbi:MAG TPA: hypothetical protein VKB41_03315 [Steroidobacteraceae bacterium]|nr:hypothetical protein [Steroidobacteraceae bacterium]
MSWIAFGALLAAWHVEGQLDQSESKNIDPRLAAGSATTTGETPIRIVRAEAGSWMESAPKGLRTR